MCLLQKWTLQSSWVICRTYASRDWGRLEDSPEHVPTGFHKKQGGPYSGPLRTTGDSPPRFSGVAAEPLAQLELLQCCDLIS